MDKKRDFRRELLPFHDLTNPEEITSMMGDVSDLHTRVTGSYTEERRLVAAMLQRAILDLIPPKYPREGTGEQALVTYHERLKERDDAIAWLTDTRTYNGHVSFLEACQILDLDYDQLNKTLEETNYFEDESRLYPFFGDKSKAHSRRRTRIVRY